MAKVLNRLWFDAVEPPDRSFYWVRANADGTYSSYIYGNSGWEIISQSTSVTVLTSDEYEALEYKDPNALYVVSDEGSSVGSMYLGTIKISGGDSGYMIFSLDNNGNLVYDVAGPLSIASFSLDDSGNICIEA